MYVPWCRTYPLGYENYRVMQAEIVAGDKETPVRVLAPASDQVSSFVMTAAQPRREVLARILHVAGDPVIDSFAFPI